MWICTAYDTETKSQCSCIAMVEVMINHFVFVQMKKKKVKVMMEFNPFAPNPAILRILLCLKPEYFALSNTRRFYSSMGNPMESTVLQYFSTIKKMNSVDLNIPK